MIAVVYADEDGDLKVRTFDTDEAKEVFLEFTEGQAYVIHTDGEIDLEDHT